MYLSRLFIQNYRSIKELDLEFAKGKNVIVGRNNAGKSNIVKALDLIFGENSPTWERSENITDNDFYSWKEIIDDKAIVKSADDLLIWCELTREIGEEINYAEINKCTGFPVYSEVISPPGFPKEKRSIPISKEKLPQHPEIIFEITEDENEDKEWVGAKAKWNQKTFRDVLEDKYCFALAFYAKKNSDGKIEKNIRFLYRESMAHRWILAFRAPIRCELLQSAIIPSFRDPQSQLRLTNWTWYGKLMKHLTATHAQSQELHEAFDKVRDVADGIFASVKTKVAQSSLNVAFPGTELFFQFNSDTKTDLYKSCVIYVDDGFRSQLTDKGSGIQSATIIGLFNYYTQHVNIVTSALLCIEEPELYLHPHARRVISDRLDEFLNNNKNQVILTTHSTEFLRTTSADLNVVLVGKHTEEGTKAKPVQIREFKHLLLDNNQNELFFADKVIVCEGFDSYVLSAIAKHYFGKRIDEENVSIITVGGKDRISKLVKLVVKLGLKCFVFADFDYLLRDRAEERKKYGAESHENILNCGLEFFSQPHIYGDKGGKAVSRITKARNFLKETSEREFYEAKSASAFNDERLAKFLSELRQKGIGLLDAEIEDLSKNRSFLAPEVKKLTLEKVFDLNAKLINGEKLEDIFDTAKVVEFLNAVFEA